MNISDSIKLKTLATNWCDDFWKTMPAIREEHNQLVKDLTAFNSSHEEDLAISQIALLCESDSVCDALRMARQYNLRMTSKAMVFVTISAQRIALVKMIMCAIVHEHHAIDIDKTDVITFQWLLRLFEGKMPDHKFFETMWDKQKSEYGNLVDFACAFELATLDEMKVLQEQQEHVD